jgi:TonB-linked SusC/RagA family outer membrane protein
MRSYVHGVAVLAAGAVLSLGLASPANAQSNGTVRGRVIEVGSQHPITEAQVTVAGTAASAVTNAAGEYVITLAPSGSHQVTARRIGYAPQTQTVDIPAGGQATADFRMTQTAAQLEQVVVTGTAGAQEKREIGNAVTQLNVADITSKATVTNVSEVLQGRTPGVIVSAGSGSPGTSSEITIRGYGSFTNNRPVIYIDGMRMDTDDIGAFNPSGAGTGGLSGQRTSALDLINPQDIESIEVIRGPAAATLYGADAAGGVIQIITKKGARGQQDLQWTARWENGWNEWGTETLTNYTTCSAARKAAVDAALNPLWSGCQGRADDEIITDDPLSRDHSALRDGKVNNLSLSLRGGGDRYSFYISGDGLRNDGVLENNYDKRRSVRTNFTFNPNTSTSFNINVGYIDQDLRLPLGDEAANGLLLSAARGIPGRTRPRESLNGWATIEPSLAHLYNNSAESHRLLLGTTVDYKPFSWWQNRLTAGMDWRSTTAQVLSLPGDPDVPAGLNALRAPTSINYSLDYSASFLAELPRDFASTTSVGAQATSRRDEQVNATGSQLPTREITIIGAALSVSGSNSFSEFNSLGAFVQQQIAWKDRIYGTLAIRMDDHSSFGANYDPIVYPKASLSWVLSDEPALTRYFDAMRSTNFRFRGAWGLAGRAPAPYAATQTYGSTRVALSPTVVGGALTASGFGNPNLKPEKGNEIELGFDSDYFGGRAGLEFTYYNKTMRDLLVPLALPPSLGFSGSMTQNLGKTSNSGIEMGITATPVDLPNFVWDGRLNMSWNHNRLDMLDTVRVCKTWKTTDCPAGKSAAEEIPGGASYSPGMQRNRVGYPLGSYFVRYPTRDADGNYVINRNATTGALTTPVYDTAFKYLGPAVPTKLFSLSNTFTFFKSFQLFGMLDYQGGHYLFNYKEYNRCALAADGPNCHRLNRPELIGTARLDTLRALYGVSGTPTTVSSPMTQTHFVEKADYIKLRDLSLSYTVPPAWARRARMQTAALVLSGRNLALWSDYSGLDPEVNGYSNNQLRGSGNAAQFVRVDAYSWPMIRRYTFHVTATY